MGKATAKKKKSKKKASKKKPKTARQLQTELTAKRKETFLDVFRKTGNVTFSASQAGVDRLTHYICWMKDPKYVEAFTSAKEEATDVLEYEARRRALKGVRKHAGFYKGRPVMRAAGPPNPETGEPNLEAIMVDEYSDTLLIFLLKGNRPEKYRERVELTDHEGRNPLTAALEDMWNKINGGGRAAVKQLPAAAVIETTAIPIDGNNRPKGQT